MPELPEVQTIVNDLNKVLPGLKVRDVWCDAVNNILINLSGDRTLKLAVLPFVAINIKSSKIRRW